MSIKRYINPQFEAVLKSDHRNDFDHLWALDIGWFEEPNQRRGGWSGVSKCIWQDEDNQALAVFIKRQQDHNGKTWLHPIKGVPTFAREMDNILCYQENDIPTLTPIFFQHERQQGHDRAILITQSLEGYQSLEEWIAQWQTDGWPKRTTRRLIITALANAVAQLHLTRLQHNCLYPKHLFLHIEDQVVDVRFIDLEKTRKVKSTRHAMMRDLGSFYRHLGVARINDQLRFMKQYLAKLTLSDELKVIWHMIDESAKAKKKAKSS